MKTNFTFFALILCLYSIPVFAQQHFETLSYPLVLSKGVTAVEGFGTGLLGEGFKLIEADTIVHQDSVFRLTYQNMDGEKVRIVYNLNSDKKDKSKPKEINRIVIQSPLKNTVGLVNRILKTNYTDATDLMAISPLKMFTTPSGNISFACYRIAGDKQQRWNIKFQRSGF